MTNVELFRGIVAKLPRQPRCCFASKDPGFWTDGESILCPSESEMKAIISLLMDAFSEDDKISFLYGYHDPNEDVRNRKVDERTGLWYINFERRRLEIKKGSVVHTPRFLDVRISEVYDNQDQLREAGYTEPTHFVDAEWEVRGKSIDLFRMEFAAARK